MQVYYNNTVKALAYNLFTVTDSKNGYGAKFDNSSVTFSKIENNISTAVWRIGISGREARFYAINSPSPRLIMDVFYNDTDAYRLEANSDGILFGNSINGNVKTIWKK